MFICEIWLFDLYFPKFCKSDMSKYRYLESDSEGPFDFEITRVDCNFVLAKKHEETSKRKRFKMLVLLQY